ncbi:penicillin-binding protein 2 [Skermanella stibiiresistens SB22]|uniref:Penicillin-binding protein 2 n=1 Tax=Skermanella stibiiresistens SB22 TaxID=1385369 RepID=W9H9M9_9PROT|nr:penicillin-binding protein 2 [Skermanella stibiiresistens]EWY41461.1 penicillin-binding protein 2 [Skermanella stibiiresistens SB22]
MERDTDRYRGLTRRALMLGGMQVGLLSTLVARMYYLQVLESDRYSTLADENRINMRLLAPSRGQVLDRFGVPLAVNQQNFRVVMVSEQARKIDRVLTLVSEIVPLTDADWRRITREIQRKRAFVPVTVKDNLSWEQVTMIEVNAPDLPGVSIEVGELRSYPYETSTAHFLGYVGAVSESELNGDPVLALPGFRIGKSGLEKFHDANLRGVAGTSQLEVNAVGRVIRELSREEGQPGRDITLTVDIGLQQYAQDRLKDQKSAAAVVMDVHTGGIYSMASNPSYDPNLFTTGINAETWEDLLSDPATPLTNKVIAGQYAPGSTFKMLVALAALDSGIIGPRHTVHCPGHMDLGDHRFHCWKRGGHGTLDLVGALKHSCDTFFYDLARRIGIDRIHDMGKRFGMGQRTQLDLPSERPGLMPSRDWKQANLGKSWTQGESLIAAIGQGYVLATPLQLAVMLSRMVNGGFAVKPHLTRQVERGPAEQTAWPPMGVNKAHIEMVIQGMNAVMNQPDGTAYKMRITEPGFEMGGKTGTSQVRRITMAERSTGVLKNDQLPWRQRDHALFIGFAPLRAPRYACAVIVEHGGGGSAVAAPIARDLLLEVQRRDSARGASQVSSAEGAPEPSPTVPNTSPRKVGG